MTDNTSDSVRRHDVELFKGIRAISSKKLKDVICTHYGVKAFDNGWQRVQGGRQRSVGCNDNLDVYLNITHSLGKKPEAVEEIMRLYKDLNRLESDTGDSAKTLKQTQLLSESTGHSVFDNATIKAAENVMGIEDFEAMTEYMEAFKCNTTRSCYLELGDSESSSDEERSEVDCEDDQQSVSMSVQGDVTQEDKCDCHVVSEAMIAEKSKVVIEDY